MFVSLSILNFTMMSRIGFHHYHVWNPDVRANIAIYSNSELRYCLLARTSTRKIPTHTFATRILPKAADER